MRARAGQGRQTLQGQARAAAEDLGHSLGRFRAAEGHSKRSVSVVIGSHVVQGAAPAVFRALCSRCGWSAVVDQHAWENDGRGYGGRATRETCVAVSEAAA